MDKENNYFLSGIRNLFTLCDKRDKPCFSAFLSEEEKAEILPLVQKLSAGGFSVLFYGGYPQAQRTILGVFPGYITPSPEDFPITAYTASFPASIILTHRDVLGTLMAQQIKRETIGDIVMQRGKTIIFAEEKVERVLATQISRIGGAGVAMEKGFEPFQAVQQYTELSGTLPSLRLDAAVAFCASKSRSAAASLISAGLCSINHRVSAKTSELLSPGDILVIRGKGKFRLESADGTTRKGRIPVTFLKYAELSFLPANENE